MPVKERKQSDKYFIRFELRVPLLPRLLGLQRAKEIFFFGEDLDADEMLRLGLVNEVLPHDELLGYAAEKAASLIPPRGAGLAVRMTKRAIHEPLIDAITRALDNENEALNKAVATHDFIEGISARKERRKPVFKGE